MPPKKNAANDAAASAPAFDQARADLVVYHLNKIRQHKPLIDKAAAEVKEAKAKLSDLQQTQTDMFHQAKADTRIDRQVLERKIKQLEGGARRIVRERDEDAFLDRALGFPVQGDLQFGDETPSEARDELEWEAEGYLAGRRGDDPTPPDGCHPRFHPAYTKGWHKGQEETQQVILRAAGIIDQRDAPNTDEATEIDEEQELEDAVDRVRNSDFMKTGGDEPTGSEPQPADAAA